jgi:hypothetical protein
MSENSVTQFIHLLRDGDQKAAAPIGTISTRDLSLWRIRDFRAAFVE